MRNFNQKLLRMVLPGHAPGEGMGDDLINTGPLNDGSTTSRITSEMSPVCSDISPRPSLPSYSDLFPNPSPTPSPIPTSIPGPARPSSLKSSSQRHTSGSSSSAASTAPPCNMDPLVKAMYHNQTISKLPRLPEKVLRAVIRNLDDCGVECLRRVSRKFTPLCGQEILTRPHTFQPRWILEDRGGPFAWPQFRIFDGRHAWWRDSPTGERQGLLRLLARDWYCESCRGAREAADWDRRVEWLTRYLYCHACKAQHPACLFSVRQRQSPASRRRCIAHEGYFRLCQHDEGIVRWSDISRIRERLEEVVENEDDCRLHCEDVTHVVSCAKTATQRSGQRKLLSDCYDHLCIERPMPELEVEGSNIWLRWTAHMPDESKGRRLTDTDLRRRIAEIRERGGRFLYPAMTFKEDVPEMRCFDLNECDCVSLEGLENVELRSESSLNPERALRPNLSRQLKSSDRSPSLFCAASGTRQLPRTHKADSPRTCESSRKPHAARWYFHSSFDVAESKVACWPCHADDSCLVVNYTRNLKIGRAGAIGQQWYQDLDPDSYSLTDDEEGFEVYWCRQKECRNYYGRGPGFSRIIRGADYHSPVARRAVGHGW